MTDTANETPAPENPETPKDMADDAAATASATGSETGAPPSATEEVAVLKDRLLRTMAEMENLRKRSERERQDAMKYAISGFARDLLQVSDNLRRAIESLPENSDGNEHLKVFREGVEMTERELLAAFEKAGIRKLEPLGEKFDHNRHEAMFEVPSTDQPPGTVVQVMQSGYMIHDRLLRPARVGVTRAADNTAPDQAKVDTRA